MVNECGDRETVMSSEAMRGSARADLKITAWK